MNFKRLANEGGIRDIKKEKKSERKKVTQQSGAGNQRQEKYQERVGGGAGDKIHVV